MGGDVSSHIDDDDDDVDDEDDDDNCTRHVTQRSSAAAAAAKPSCDSRPPHRLPPDHPWRFYDLPFDSESVNRFTGPTEHGVRSSWSRGPRPEL